MKTIGKYEILASFEANDHTTVLGQHEPSIFSDHPTDFVIATLDTDGTGLLFPRYFGDDGAKLRAVQAFAALLTRNLMGG